jgi:hypothetical protein
MQEAGFLFLVLRVRESHLAACSSFLSMSQGEDGWTPLFRACYNNHLELAKYLAENGANLGRDADDFQNTALHACCINGHRQVAEFLLTKGVDVNDHDNVGGWTPLYAASFFAWPELVRLLLEKGADPSIACKEGKTALHVVCEAGYRGEHRPTIMALLQNLPEPTEARPRDGRGRGLRGEGEREGGRTSHRHHQHYHQSLEAQARGHLALKSSSSEGGKVEIGVAGPPPYTEDGSGKRTYFPWELGSADYAWRAAGLCRGMLTRVLAEVVETGRLAALPAEATVRKGKEFEKPFVDVFDLLEAAMQVAETLETFAHEKKGGVGGRWPATMKGNDKEKAGGEVERAAANGEDDADLSLSRCSLDCNQDEGATMPLGERLKLLGIAFSVQLNPAHHPQRGETGALLACLYTVATRLSQEDVAERVHSLLAQYHSHSESKSLRLRLLRVSQIRGPLEGHERVSRRAACPGEDTDPLISTGKDAQSSERRRSPSCSSSESKDSAGAGMVGGLSGGFSPVGRGGDGGEKGERMLARAEERERSKREYLEQFKFLKEHAQDLILSDDI